MGGGGAKEMIAVKGIGDEWMGWRESERQRSGWGGGREMGALYTDIPSRHKDFFLILIHVLSVW